MPAHLRCRVLGHPPAMTFRFLATFTYTRTNPMSHGPLFRIAALAALAFSCVASHAQSLAEPTAYTVTVQYQITGTALRTTYRLGSRVLVDQIPSPGIPASATPAAPTRTLYFLDTRQ